MASSVGFELFTFVWRSAATNCTHTDDMTDFESDHPRHSSGEFTNKSQSPPETELTPRAQFLRQHARRIGQVTRGLRPDTTRVAFTYPVNSTPQLAYLLDFEDHASTLTAADGPISSSVDGWVQHEDPTDVLNVMLEEFADFDEMQDAGLLTSDDGVVFILEV
jgi:hypothetical protein